VFTNNISFQDLSRLENQDSEYVPINENWNWYYQILVNFGSHIPILLISYYNHRHVLVELYKYLPENKEDDTYSYKSRFCCMFGMQIIFMLLYTAIPVVALLGSHGPVQPNILLSMRDSQMGTILQVLSSVGILISLLFFYTPELVEMTRSFFEKLSYMLWYKLDSKCSFQCCGCYNRDISKWDDTEDHVSIFFCALLVAALIFFVAEFSGDNLSEYMGLAGSISAPIIIIYPASALILTLKDADLDEWSHKAFWIFSWFLIIIGVFIFISGILWAFKVGLVKNPLLFNGGNPTS
jgi:hypothetical protein